MNHELTKDQEKESPQRASNALTEITKTLERLIERAPSTPPENPAPDGSTKQDRIKHLLDRGFPPRHLLFLDHMQGPGLEKAREIAPRVQSGDCLLILCGDRGPGKTQIATWWAFYCGCYSVQYFKAHDLIRAIRGEFSEDHDDRGVARQTLRRALSVRLLILDEFSELAGSDYDLRTLSNILDHRYDKMLATVIITNTPPARVGQEVGRSVYSRCEEVGGIIHCDWTSYRSGSRTTDA